MNDFDNHEIRSHVKDLGFGSWLLQSKYPDGKDWTSNLWCRITAADGLLRVSGDFEPIIFAHGPRDPQACVQWMGKEKHLSSYAVEKARIGSGRDACTSEDTDDAREDIAAKIAELREEIAEATFSLNADLDPGEFEESPQDDHEIRTLKAEVKAWQVALAVDDDYSGREGVFMLLHALWCGDERGVIDSEQLIGIGARPSMPLKFAHAAVRRLHELLQAEPVVTDTGQQATALLAHVRAAKAEV